MSYRILVATDFSPASDYAVRYALAMLARTSGAELHVAHVVVDAARHARLDLADRLLRESRDRLRSLVDATQAAPAERTVERTVVGHVRLARSAADAIEQLALDVDADVVVVGTHHRRAFDRLLLGSVAEELLRRGRIPLLVARPCAFAGMERTPAIDTARASADVHEARHDMPASSERITWTGSPAHIAGLL